MVRGEDGEGSAMLFDALGTRLLVLRDGVVVGARWAASRRDFVTGTRTLELALGVGELGRVLLRLRGGVAGGVLLGLVARSGIFGRELRRRVWAWSRLYCFRASEATCCWTSALAASSSRRAPSAAACCSSAMVSAVRTVFVGERGDVRGLEVDRRAVVLGSAPRRALARARSSHSASARSRCSTFAFASARSLSTFVFASARSLSLVACSRSGGSLRRGLGGLRQQRRMVRAGVSAERRGVGALLVSRSRRRARRAARACSATCASACCSSARGVRAHRSGDGFFVRGLRGGECAFELRDLAAELALSRLCSPACSALSATMPLACCCSSALTAASCSAAFARRSASICSSIAAPCAASSSSRTCAIAACFAASALVRAFASSLE